MPVIRQATKGLLRGRGQLAREGNIDPPTGPPPMFDTILTFNPILADDAEGVGAVVTSPADNDEKFEFNAIANPAGQPQTMTLNVLGSNVAEVNFPADYLGAAFAYISKSSVTYNGTFASGTVVF